MGDQEPVRCRKRDPEYDKPVLWWPPGPEGPKHPLKGNHRRESVRSKSTPAKPAAGRARAHYFNPTPRGMKHGEFTQSNFEHQVPVGKRSVDRASSQRRPKEFEGSAGKKAEEDHAHYRRTGYAWGNVKEASSEIQKHFEKAAGVPSGYVENNELISHKKTDFHHRAASKNFHRGIHAGDVQEAGVIDFAPTHQGRKARNVAKRASHVGTLLRTGDTEAVPAFKGNPNTYEGAAGIGSGSLQNDMRYVSSGEGWH